MALDLWFRDDLRRILNSKEQAAAEFRDPYRLGYLACIAHLRTEFGLNDPIVYEQHCERWLRPGDFSTDVSVHPIK